jgi:outer membrane lipoprotein-sorting protein
MRIFGLMILGAAGLLAADSQEPSQAQIDEIVQKFAAKEADFAKARESYTYHQTARIQELSPSGNVEGRWETVSDIVFDGAGKRSEKVVRAPVSSLSKILLTPEDMEDLKSVQPFVLTTAELPKYLIRYLGKETLDEIPCYAFAVKPKRVDPGQRYFEGIVWVDDRDLQIVKSYGRGTGVFKKGNAYPKFETYREQIDGKYWFPTYTIANATLHFPEFDQRLKQTVRYEDYKQFKATTTITFGDEVEQPKQEKKPDSPAKKP